MYTQTRAASLFIITVYDSITNKEEVEDIPVSFPTSEFNSLSPLCFLHVLLSHEDLSLLTNTLIPPEKKDIFYIYNTKVYIHTISGHLTLTTTTHLWCMVRLILGPPERLQPLIAGQTAQFVLTVPDLELDLMRK